MKKALELFKSVTPPEVSLGGAFAVSGITGAADAFLASTCGGKVLCVTAGIPDAERLFDDLKLLGASAYYFPAMLPGDKGSYGARMKAMAAVKTLEDVVVVAPYVALTQPMPAENVEPVVLEVGGAGLSAEMLTKLGYERKPQVEQEGDFSIRGGIVDVWSPGEELPVRAEFFGEDLESLRLFDAATQISVEKVKSATLLPITNDELQITNDGREEFLGSFRVVLGFNSREYELGVELREVALNTSALPGFRELGAEEAHHPELFESARQRLEKHVAAAKKKGSYVLKLDELSGGFEVPGLVVVAKSDRVFARRKVHVVAGKNTRLPVSGQRLDSFDELEPGEYVVHLDYGVGKYLGSHFVNRDGEQVEVFTVEYADGAKLHVPAAHAHLLSRYVGVKGMDVKVHKLDGKRWSKDKADAQKAINDLASQLLDVQAKREVVPGFAYKVKDLEGLSAFESSFPYEETPDQNTAIAAIKHDLGEMKPMDRLICGDAGYGKTEVAMRAAYIAAMNGKQVAVLAPTTVLAEQHFETFTSRFDGTPIRIESVSRFQSKDTHNGTFRRLATGACDIVIGTHAILNPSIAFHDLGLIIIDEEQRFGVRHKEFLKALRATADVLTLSATPIPRTLYLSMTGARDLSLLRSPPRERVAVATHVVPHSDCVIKEAIEAELKRGGQVFFLHNRVSTISKVEKGLKTLLPKVKVIVAHGQMDARTLAMKMRAFERGEADILLSTTIVESGIDIPRANTILVDRADMFGLAELYQLRGRVGRSSKEGQAYFLLPGEGLVDSNARERLDALKRHGGLGAGFNLAVRDLELRGAGNLLGSKQSGHIANVGFTLYCQLLQRTIARLKGEKVNEVIDVKLNLDFYSASIPYEYVEEETQRLSLMKRFAEAQDLTVIHALRDEMRDRYGKLPPEAERFVRLAIFRLRCAHKQIAAVDAHNNRAVFYGAHNREIVNVVTLDPELSPERKLSILSACIS